MKTLKLLLLFLFLTGTVFAQHVANEEMSNIVQNDAEKVAIVNDDNIETIIRQRPKRIDKHEFRVGVGSYSMAADMFLDDEYWVDYDPSFREQMLDAETYLTDRRFVGTYSLSYTYHSRRWFQYGGTVWFGAVTQSRRDNLTDRKIEQLNEFMVGVMPTVRFVYMYRDNVQLYSSLSLGVVVGSGASFLWADATLFGCSFGRKLFGFAEIGTGIGGWGRVGIGYRFDSSRKGKK